MAPAAARALGVGALSWSPPRALSNGMFVSPPDATAAKVRFTRRAGGNRTVRGLASGSGGPRDGEWWESTDASWDGQLVDEDMDTLRRRINEARVAHEHEEEEGGIDGDVLPAEWTDLERRHHGSYVAGVCGAVGLLQAFLMRTRPALGAGVVALVLLSLPASVLLVSAQLIQAVDSISSAVLNGRM